MRNVSRSTRARKESEFSKSYRKVMCELHLMRLGGMITVSEFRTMKNAIDEAFETACNEYGIKSSLALNFVPEFVPASDTRWLLPSLGAVSI